MTPLSARQSSTSLVNTQLIKRLHFIPSNREANLFSQYHWTPRCQQGQSILKVSYRLRSSQPCSGSLSLHRRLNLMLFIGEMSSETQRNGSALFCMVSLVRPLQGTRGYFEGLPRTSPNRTQLTSSNKRLVTITLISVLASMAVIVARQIETLHDIFFKEREMQSFYSWFISDGSKKLKPITFSNSKRMSPNFYSPQDITVWVVLQCFALKEKTIDVKMCIIRPKSNLQPTRLVIALSSPSNFQKHSNLLSKAKSQINLIESRGSY